MATGWLICAGLIYAMVPPLNFVSSLVIAACLTPTDPILAAAVVGGKYAEKHVPEHLRHLLYAESGCNDGAAFPFLFIALYIILEQDDRVAVEKWFYITWACRCLRGELNPYLTHFIRRNHPRNHNWCPDWLGFSALAKILRGPRLH
jgi:NhaP-type Na+/H+ or K+/H+ antiporter